MCRGRVSSVKAFACDYRYCCNQRAGHYIDCTARAVTDGDENVKSACNVTNLSHKSNATTNDGFLDGVNGE